MIDKAKIRAGCKDIWNAFMAKGANFQTNSNDIPFYPTTADELPSRLISYSKAKTLYNNCKKNQIKDFEIDAFVHFYTDDQKFDGKRSGIWSNPWGSAEILQHFAGIITPDFSTYADFPFQLKFINTYKMRLFGYWYGSLGYAVINNVRWGTEETFSYCFDGIPKNSIVAIGTVASGLRTLENRKIFEQGFYKMIEVLKPHTIIVYGSDKYSFFDNVREYIRIIQFNSECAEAFAGVTP